MSGDDFQSGDVPPPDFLVPGVRCGLEMALVGLAVLLVGLPAENALYFGVVVLAALLAMTVVLFWCLNQHVANWIRRAQGRPTMTDGGGKP
ncbi:MAG: hypothetical protein ABEJ89_07030 [Haloarculaceae archaeon]